MVTATDECVIRIDKGLVRGRVVDNVLDGSYFSFQGMRYAKPPLGKLRFKAPVEEEPWEGIYDATCEGECATQYVRNTNEIIGSEDCLFINVYTNELPKPDVAPKAVIFWLHGGAWTTGSGNTDLYGPDYLLTKDVVVVTFNHRLGFIGLASFEDPEIDTPGNAILKDILRALEWVQTNIQYFNGDANNVTIMGESSGGSEIHILAEVEYGHFWHKIIAMSSTNGNYLKPNLENNTHEVAEVLGYTGTNEREIYEFLLAQPAEKFLEAGEILLKKNNNIYTDTFRVVLEKPCKSERRALVTPMLHDIRKPHPNPRPLLIGNTSEDGMLHASAFALDKFLPPNFTQVQNCVPMDILDKLNIDRDSDRAKAIGEEIKQFYYGNETPSYRSLDTYTKLQTDIKYRLTAKLCILCYTTYTPGYPTYLYRFSLDSPSNLYKKLYGLKHIKGACHSDELTYLFHSRFSFPLRKGSIEEKTRERMLTYWTNFAKYGDPNPKVPTPIVNVTWEPVKPGMLNHVDIGLKLKAVNDQPDAKRMKFWDDLYEKLGIELI